MEMIAEEQSVLGADIQKLHKRITKDSYERKTREYLDTMMADLDSYWKKFQANHANLQLMKDENTEHPYFKLGYYDAITVVCRDIKLWIRKAEDKLAAKTSNEITTASFDKEGEEPNKFKVASDPVSQDEELLVKLIRRQKALMKSIALFIKDIESKLEERQVRAYYEFKKTRLQEYELQLSQNDQLIWENTVVENSEGYTAEYYNELMSWLHDTVIILQQQLQEATDSVESSTEISSNIKLPQITLPCFDGNYLGWPEFYDLYTQLIHSRSIGKAQKMHYLISNLTGEAKRLIKHLPVSAENYDDAWTIIKNRYNNKKLLVNHLLTKLLSQSSCVTESATAIKSLHDTTNECLMALKNLGLSIDTWDPILLYLLIKKLDRSTHALYEQSLAEPRELSTVNEFLRFLEYRFQSLEVTGGSNHRQSKPSSLLTASNAVKCVVCQELHPLYACKAFLALTPEVRLEVAKRHNLCLNCLKQGHRSKQCSSRSCKSCEKKHNSLLHLDALAVKTRQQNTTTHNTTTVKSQNNLGSIQNKPSSTTLVAQENTDKNKYVMLSTIVVNISAPDGQQYECRAILDSGSQLNFITKQLVNKLGLNVTPEKLNIRGIGQGKQTAESKVNVLLHSRATGHSTRIEAFTLTQITTDQPSRFIDVSAWPIPKNIKLADPEYNYPARIDLLIGAENYLELLSVGQIRLGPKLPILQNTVFGWILSGKVVEKSPSEVCCGICSHDSNELENKVQNFWKLDDVEPAAQLTHQERICEEHFNTHTIHEKDGRFVVKLPFAKDPLLLGDSKERALQRFLSLERKLNKDQSLKNQYTNFIEEYLRLGHMEEVNMNDIPKPHYFLPHHCVLRPDSTTTKLRVVFDASAKTSTNISLNDILYTGPSLQEDVFTILLRFRLPKFVFTADIEKMYRQVRVRKEDQKYQLILWRDNPNESVRCYQLSTVTYGVTTAPYLAIKCLRRLASENEISSPLAAEAITSNIYVDDVMAGSNSLRQTIEMKNQLRQVLLSGGFKLRKWCANHTQLLEGISNDDRAIQFTVNGKHDEHIKTLGVNWLPNSDNFRVQVLQSNETRVTKRTVSSDIAHIFDPLGIMSPVVIKAKIFLQKLWKLNLEWDAAVPMEMHTQWVNFRQQLKTLENIQFPRHLFSRGTPHSIQIHAFSDASEKAYGSAIYIRSKHKDGTIAVRLLCAKSKVAPTKIVSLPRLELQAATLTAKLAIRGKKDLHWKEIPCTFWTDSEIVLAWLRKPSSSYVTFIANRVAAIQELTSVDQWRHVPTKENPADVVSRGISPEKLSETLCWFYGPIFLNGAEQSWPVNPKFETTLEMKPAKVVLSVVEDTDNFLATIDHRNSFQHLRRVVAYMLRFINNARNSESSQRRKKYLCIDELEAATRLIIQESQRRGFPGDLALLKKSKMVDKQSNLSALTPFLDQNGIIRVGGRLQEANIAYDAKHPMLLPYSDQITRLIMTEYHVKNSHIGPQGLLAITRQRFWPIKGKTIARSIVLNCVHCSKTKPKLLTQMMGTLPEKRVQPSRPFWTTGVDFCGPFWTHFKIRGKKPQKTYVAVFVCFATKAVHLEVVSDLTTNAFIGALKRFVSRRGNCRHLYCDNATNFVGARNQLEELRLTIYSKTAEEQIDKFCTSRGTEFHFIPPRAPHFGGLWEAAVKSVKTLLPSSMNNHSLTYEELETVITQVEAILNSRPITPMSSDPNDLTALTPGHFLTGEPLTSIAEPVEQPSRADLHTQWKRIVHLKTEFWQRWVKEYLSELQYRGKWKQRCNNAEPGMMVVIKENNVPPMQWSLGRIIETIKGDDDLVRVAIVKTAGGVIKRPIHNLAPLPIESSSSISTEVEVQSQDSNEVASEARKTKRTADRREVPLKSKKSRGSHSPISLVLLTCLILPIFGLEQICVTPFKSNPGLYYERLGHTFLSSDEWNVVVFYNTTNYWREATVIKKGLSNLNHICTDIIVKVSCEPALSHFQDMINEIEEGNKLLRQHEHSRKRRAPLNIIGNVANSLFGVLDSSYAEQMADIINSLDKTDQHLLDLLRNQTSVIDSTINIMNDTYGRMEGRLKEFDEYLNQTIYSIKSINYEFHQEKLIEYFNTLSIRLMLLITKYRNIQNVLLKTMTDTHHGKVSPQLLTPDQLRRQLIIIKENLPANLRLIEARKNLLNLYGIMSIEGRMLGDQLIFRIKLPLISHESFELLHIVPVPIAMSDGFYSMSISTSFIIVNLHRDLYYPMSELELSRCAIINHSEYLCRQNHPLYRKGSISSRCEFTILTESGPDTSCNFIRTNEINRWTQLSSPNHWMYVVQQPTSINIVCDNRMQSKTLTGSGIINTTNGCIIKDESTILQANTVYSSMIKDSFIPSKNVPDVVPVVEFSVEHLSSAWDTLEPKLKALHDKVASLKTAEANSATNAHHHIHHYSIGYSSLAIAIICLSCLLWRFFRRHAEPKSSRPPVPAPRQLPPDAFKIDAEISL